MIDDVTLTTTTAEPIHLPGRPILRSLQDRSGKMYTWEIAARNGLVLRTCPERQLCELRISFPRVANRSGYNFPLRPAASVDLARVAWDLCRLFGWDVERADDARRREAWAQTLTTIWGVRKIAFATDVVVADRPQLLETLAARPRRGRAPQRWGHPAHGVQWDGQDMRVQLYDKSVEIRGRIPQILRQQAEHGPAAADERRELAGQAHGVVRFEVTLKNAKAIRKLVGLTAGRLPTLRYMIDEEIGAYVVGREATKLGLLPPPDPPSGEGTDVLALARALGEAARRRADEQHDAGRRSPARLRGTTLAALGFIHQLQGFAERGSVLEALGMTPRTFADRVRDLRRLGLPALGTADPTGHREAGRFARALVDAVGEFPPWISTPLAEEDVVAAPWADGEPEASEIVLEEGQADQTLDVTTPPEMSPPEAEPHAVTPVTVPTGRVGPVVLPPMQVAPPAVRSRLLNAVTPATVPTGRVGPVVLPPMQVAPPAVRSRLLTSPRPALVDLKQLRGALPDEDDDGTPLQVSMLDHDEDPETSGDDCSSLTGGLGDLAPEDMAGDYSGDD